MILAAILITLLILYVLLAMYLASYVMKIDRKTLEESLAWQTAHYDTSYYADLKKTDYTVTMNDGYILHVQLLENPKPVTDYVIITHGYTDNRMEDLKYAKMYLDLGYNCVIYDLRGHGENEPTYTTYGIREGEDLNCLIADTRKRYPDLTSLGLHGESLGSATTITCLKYHPEVDFAVADCGFSDIENVLKGMAPGFIIDIANTGAKLKYRHAIKDMRPIDALDDNEVPVLFIHGADDELISPKNSEDMAKRTKGRSEFHIIPGAKHAVSIIVEPEMYADIVRNFLGK